MRELSTSLLQALFCVIHHQFSVRPGALWPPISDANVAVIREPRLFTVLLEVRADREKAAQASRGRLSLMRVLLSQTT